MYIVKDRYGSKVKGFKSLADAIEYKAIYGNSGWYIMNETR